MQRINPDWSSHIPVLIRALEITDGPVLELGIGYGSTPLLHALCFEKNRPLVSYEHRGEWVKTFQKYIDAGHEIIAVTDWDDIDLGRLKWSVALVDHAPAERRVEEIRRLCDLNVEFIIVHDTQPIAEDEYRYSQIYPLFKYRWDYTKLGCHVAVLSNVREFPWQQ